MSIVDNGRFWKLYTYYAYFNTGLLIGRGLIHFHADVGESYNIAAITIYLDLSSRGIHRFKDRNS